jgi:signal transduction histidine kinase
MIARFARRLAARTARWSATRFAAAGFALVFLVASVGVVHAITRELHAQAVRDATARAEQVLHRNMAIHAYMNEQLKPAVFSVLGRPPGRDVPFDAAWMSSTYAVRQMNALYRKHGGDTASVAYKEAAVNARSPSNEADAEERAFLAHAAADPSLVTSSAIREIEGRRYLVVTRRGETMERACLRCHGDPLEAPADLVRAYGASRSFYRREGELVSAISVRVPLEAAYASASAFTLRLSLTLLAVLGAALWYQFVMQRSFILRPLARLADAARALARSPSSVERVPLPRSRELRVLTRVFNAAARTVARRDEHLERAVEERTRELREGEAARRSLLAQLATRDRLASLGTLAAGLAHELNNPLACVSANLSFLEEEVRGALPPEAQREVDAASREANDAAARMKAVVAALTRFAQPGHPDRVAEVDVGAEIAVAVEMTSHRLTRMGRLEVSVPGSLPRVLAHDLELRQVFVNLLANAADALPERGPGNLVRVTARAEPDAVVVVVEDSGRGIPPDVLPRIFDPFVTTKDVGQGVGLGLSVCHGIVQSVGGRIDVETEVGKGTRFRVTLPVARPDGEARDDRTAARG